MLRTNTSIARDKDIEALVCRNKTKVLILCFGTLSHAAGDTTFDLVRSSDALVSLLEPDGHTNTVANAKSTPRSTHTAFDCSKRFGVSVPTFHAALHELGPDIDEILLAGSEHVNALTTCDLHVQIVLLGDSTDNQELVGCDLSSSNSGHDRVCPVSLDVCQEFVVGVL